VRCGERERERRRKREKREKKRKRGTVGLFSTAEKRKIEPR
jgi:hypothetical protein